MIHTKIIKKAKQETDDNVTMAYVTHYLQSIGGKTESFFKNKAESYIDSKNIDNIKWKVPFPPVKNPDFSFIDLFAGIGGIRIALQNLKGKCVFSSEWDKFSQETYEYNFGEVPFGDITDINEKNIPNHDILAAGFPCQAFSIAGRRNGFEDTRGTLFFHISRILKEKRPKAFLLENVKGLVNHNGGKTLDVILRVLRDDLGYHVPDPKVLDAQDYGVPQSRNRIYIVGFKNKKYAEKFCYPEPIKLKKTFGAIKEKNPVSVKYYLSTRYLKTLKKHRSRHEAKGNGFGYETIKDDETANAIVIGGMGKERNLVYDDRLENFIPVTNIKGRVNRKGIRRMTPREWARLQGFPDKFLIEVSDTQAYKQFANSVPIPVVKAVGKNILKAMELSDE